MINTDIPLSEIEKAIAENNLTEALVLIQNAIGQTDGGIAGQFFESKEDEMWIQYNLEQRRQILFDYLQAEQAYYEMFKQAA